MVTKGPTYINGNPPALEEPQILLILKHAGGSRNGSLCKRQSVSFGNVALLASLSISKSQSIAESCVRAGVALAATEIQPLLEMELWVFVVICLVGTEHAYCGCATRKVSCVIWGSAAVSFPASPSCARLFPTPVAAACSQMQSPTAALFIAISQIYDYNYKS